jgi:8-oxo-dGTP pyrophosphatase MutT (NUDIX family)
MESDERGSNWRTISSRSIHRDRWIHLRADDCLTPRGQEIAPYYVLEFRHFVHVIAIEETGKLVMVRQYRHGVESNSLELPGGVMDEEESEPRETAARELSEETGYVAERFEEIARLSPDPARYSNRLIIFLACNARLANVQALGEGEDIEVELLPWDRAIHLALSGGIINAGHVAALLIAAKKVEFQIESDCV